MTHLQETKEIGHRNTLTCLFLREIVAVVIYKLTSEGALSIQLNK